MSSLHKTNKFLQLLQKDGIQFKAVISSDYHSMSSSFLPTALKYECREIGRSIFKCTKACKKNKSDEWKFKLKSRGLTWYIAFT